MFHINLVGIIWMFSSAQKLQFMYKEYFYCVVVTWSVSLLHFNYVSYSDHLIIYSSFIWICDSSLPTASYILSINFFNTTLYLYCFMEKIGDMCHIIIHKWIVLHLHGQCNIIRNFVSFIIEVVYGTLFARLCFRGSFLVISHLWNQYCEWWVSYEA